MTNPEDLAAHSGSRYWEQRARHWLEVAKDQDEAGNSDEAEAARLVAGNCARLWVENRIRDAGEAEIPAEWAEVKGLVDHAEVTHAIEEHVYLLRTADIRALHVFERVSEGN